MLDNPLLTEGLGTLTVHALNKLYEEPCCPQCCAPCHFLERLADAPGPLLEAVVMQAPAELSHRWLYGDDTDGIRSNVILGIDRDWLASRWYCQNEPTCNRDENHSVGSATCP